MVPIGNVVKEMKIGNTLIRICDDAYRNNTPEDNRRLKKELMNACWDAVRSIRAAGKDI
jgi:hypothetical protein